LSSFFAKANAKHINVKYILNGKYYISIPKDKIFFEWKPSNLNRYETKLATRKGD
jgi:hypothetical protein